jgi:hypothetical protein
LFYTVAGALHIPHDFIACGMLTQDVRALLDEHFMCNDILLVPRECNSATHNLASLSLGWTQANPLFGQAPSRNL